MKKYIYRIFIVLMVGSFISCQDFLDVNHDPNNSESSSPKLTFPAGVASAGAQFDTYYNILGGMWVQYWTQDNGSNQYKDIDAYNVQQSTLDAQFREIYSGALNDFEFVKNEAAKVQDWNFYLMATVMQAYTFQQMADIYDQIPFNEALQGANVLHPHYLSGQEVYDSLIVRIDNALSKDFSATTVTNPGASDLLFSGDINKWIQFANTLKLKIYLRQVYVRPDVAANGIAALYGAGAQFLAEDVAMTQFINQENKSNPLYESDQRKLNTANNIRGSKTFIDFLLANNDPRVDSLFIKGSDGQKGLEQGNFGVPTGVINPATISRAKIKPDDPVYFMTAAESYFLQAEAVGRGLATGDDKALYDAGVIAAFERLSLDGSAFVEPGGAYEYPVGDFETVRLKAIATQKWVALAGIENLESFFERNRTGYPIVSPVDYSSETYVPGELVYPKGGVTGGIFPKRLLFPQSERNRNPNTPAQVPYTTKVWWDTK